MPKYNFNPSEIFLPIPSVCWHVVPLHATDRKPSSGCIKWLGCKLIRTPSQNSNVRWYEVQKSGDPDDLEKRDHICAYESPFRFQGQTSQIRFTMSRTLGNVKCLNQGN